MKLLKAANRLVTREEIVWCYRNLLGREPESEKAILAHANCKSFKDLVARFVGSPEFLDKAKIARRLPAGPVGGFSARRTVPIGELPGYCFRDRRARAMRGRVSYPEDQHGRLRLLKIGCHGHVDPADLEGVEIDLGSVCGLNIQISSSNTRVKVGERAFGDWRLNLFRDPCVEIGDGVTCNGTVVMVDNGDLVVGSDCMLANAFIHVGDNHAVFDVQSGAVLNVRRAQVRLEPHVWLAARATVIGDSTVGAGSIIAANATVKGDVPRCVLAAGTPARVVRSGVSWTRSPTGHEWREVVDGLAGEGLL